MICGSWSFFVGLFLAGAAAVLLGHPAMHEWHDRIYAVSDESPPPPAVVAPPRPAPLAAFLHTTDVDHAVEAAKLFIQYYRSPEYDASLRHLIEHEWTTENQGVYNLLQHAYLIPADLRFITLLKGLHEKEDTQYRLAAAIGVQFSSAAIARIPDADFTFRRELLDYAAAHLDDDFLSARAFLAIRERLMHPRDTKFVLALMGELNWRNALTWMIKNVRKNGDTSAPGTAATQLGLEEESLTRGEFKELLLKTIAEEKQAAEAGSLVDPSVTDSTALPWTAAWSSRLLNLDVDTVLQRVGAALDDHHEQLAHGGKSKLYLYQEIDVPSYAPLQMGEISPSGEVTYAGGSASMKPITTAEKEAADAAAAAVRQKKELQRQEVQRQQLSDSASTAVHPDQVVRASAAAIESL